MTVEFRCPGCNKLLRSENETAGQAVKCPQCGSVLQIPIARPAERPELLSDSSEVRPSSPFEPAITQTTLPEDAKVYRSQLDYIRDSFAQAGPGNLASPLSRLLGAVVDNFLYALAFIAGLVIGSALPGGTEDLPFLLATLCPLGIAILQWILVAWSGQSLGKKAVGTRIVDYRSTANPGLLRVVILRSWVPGILKAIPLAGAIFALFDVLWIFGPERRCLHDLIASTRVINARNTPNV